MVDDLDKPLGQNNPPNSKIKQSKDQKMARRGWRSLVQFRRGQLSLTRIIFGIFFAVIALLISIIIFVEDMDGGRPIAQVQISSLPTDNQIINETTPKEIIEPALTNNPTTITTDGNLTIINVGDDVPDELDGTSISIGALNDFGVVPELVEQTPNGPIPIIGTNGDRPFIAYQRASITPSSANGKKLIAIIVTGLGISESGTLDAIEKLPGTITLAFAPYGRTLKSTSAIARNDGHELLLAIPLEPFDYPDNDPGPQTLLTDQPIRANLDRLFWLMARIGGYIGVINHTGAKFTASAKDFKPIMEEFSLRGLAYVDDGSSKRSISANLANNNRVPFARADMQIDIIPSRTKILAQLTELEKLANKNGSAIGVASALPVSIETIAQWSKTLEEKNIILVPISALMSSPQ